MRYQSLHGALARIETADTFFGRFLGLMFRKSLPRGSGLLLRDCARIHTCFMRFAIDVVYLSRDFAVLAVETALPPWRVGRLVKGARHVLEMNPHEAVFAVGERIVKPLHMEVRDYEA